MSNVLIVYGSTTGNTADIAEYLGGVCGLRGMSPMYGRRRRFPGWPVRRPGCRSVRVLRMGDR